MEDLLPGALVLKLLRHAEVYAPEALGRRDLLVADGRIAALAPELPSLPPALGAEEIDLTGRRLVPGFIDAHVHVTGGGGEAGPATRVPPLQLTELSLAGVTTAVGVLGTDGTTRTMQELVARTLALREEGLSAYCYTGSYEVPVRTLTGSVRGDIAFIDPVIGVGELALSDHRSSQPTFDELVRIAADCHVGGLLTGKAGVLHLHLGDGPRGLAMISRAIEETEIPARVFWPTHVNRNPRLFAEAMELAQHGSPIDITAFPADGDSLSAEDAIRRCFDSQIPIERITCSSDGAGCLPTFDKDGRLIEMDIGRPSALWATLSRLLARKVPLEFALRPFTRNVAEHLRLTRKGRIAVGSDADLVVLDTAGQPADVMARGRWLVRGGVAAVRGPFEKQKERA